MVWRGAPLGKLQRFTNAITVAIARGQGGPTLWPEQMSKLGNYGLAIWWDVYFDSEAAENLQARSRIT